MLYTENDERENLKTLGRKRHRKSKNMSKYNRLSSVLQFSILCLATQTKH